MKSGKDRDRISAEHGIIASEMESAGAHKNKAWQDYAAATAAAVGRTLLERYVREDGDGALVEPQGKPSRKDDNPTTAEASQPAMVKFGNRDSGFQAGSIYSSISGLKFGEK
ncbi:hypothetical protein G3M48_008095 [Beauveria asiatica]|uniref:Uncharacterized protein n=1 Tax=Beauveria asiatica TaxID=1069075 RepID=A0AAW0RKX2_9HYPO